MPRVSADTVKEVIATNIADNVLKRNQIDTAHVYVNDHLLEAGLSDEMLVKIELYLAAHYVALTTDGGGVTRDKLGDADMSFANIYGEGLRSTRFGQAALALDASGTLARLAQSNLKADFRVV